MLRFFIKIFYVPYRFGFVFGVSFFTAMGYWVANKQQYPLGNFYQKLFDRLGGAFIKAGQSLAMRQDKIPIEHCEALSRLLDEVRPFSSEKGHRIIEKELGKPISELFSRISKDPVASASFSQVYRACDAEGHEFAVKVKRPWIEEVVFADAFFIRAAAFFFSLTPLGRRMRAWETAGEIINTLYEELDYGREADFLKISWRYAQEIPGFKTPRFYKQFSTRNLLTMDFMEGISLREIISRIRKAPGEIVLDTAGHPIDLKKMGAQIYEIVMRCIFELGFFHADPHPGNIILMEGGNLGFIDFGIMGFLSDEGRKLNLRYLNAVARGRTQEAAEIFTQIVTPGPDANVEGLTRDMTLLLEVWTTATHDPAADFADKSSAIILQRSIEYAKKHRFFLSQNEVLYYKTLLTIDHLNIELNPSYDSVAQTEEYLSGFFQRRAASDINMDSFMEQNEKLRDFLTHTPETLVSIRELLERQLDQDAQASSPQPKNSWIPGFMGKALILGAVGLLLLKFVWNHASLQPWDYILVGVISGFIFLLGGMLILAGRNLRKHK